MRLPVIGSKVLFPEIILKKTIEANITGTSLVSTKEKALQNGFRICDNPSRNKALVTASGVMGRYVCEIEHDGDRVVKTLLLFND